ncbi:MAG: hypothetical protein CM1200mP2_55680 [Planctomycetaceae bacterium]|nr:MAG: hypothetical protein CM1200mP2_55680 [Planctomycetaceae bacterium]
MKTSAPGTDGMGNDEKCRRGKFGDDEDEHADEGT